MLTALRLATSSIRRALFGPSKSELYARYRAAAAMMSPELADEELLAMGPEEWSKHVELRNVEQERFTAAVSSEEFERAFVSYGPHWVSIDPLGTTLAKGATLRLGDEWFRYHRVRGQYPTVPG